MTTWGSTGTLTRRADEQRKVDLRKQRALEREAGRVQRGRLASRDDDYAELPAEPPPGWARGGR